MPAQCSHLLHQLNSCPKWWLIRDKAGTSSAVSVLQLQQICKGNSDRQVVLTFGRRSKEHHNFLISLFYLPKVEGTGENIWVFVALIHYKYRDMQTGTFWCFQDFQDCQINLWVVCFGGFFFSFFFFFTEQSCSLGACSPKLHDKAEYLLKSYCSIFDILQKEKGFWTITFVDAHPLYHFPLADFTQ